MTENEISYKIRGAIFNVYSHLGPGLLESAYEASLIHELQNFGLKVKAQVPLPLIYKSIKLEVGYRVDLIVNDIVLIEIKSVETLNKVSQTGVDLFKTFRIKLGILVNFNSNNISENIYRKAHNL